MAALKTRLKPNFPSFFQNLDPISKFIFISLGLASVSLFALTTLKLVNRFTGPQLTLAAGDPTGESYIISEAIEKVVERKSNIRITVEPTGGTAESLEMLESGSAALAAAQADVAAEEMDVLPSGKSQSSKSKANAAVRTVTVLYKDLFQLVVRDPNIQQFVQLRGKTVALPAKGGQYKSFLKLAEHYGLVKEDKKTPDVIITGLKSKYYDDQQAEEDFKFQRADALFRVRAAGNLGISTLVQDYGGRLVAIQQAEAMKIKHPAFESAIIPQGAYRGNPPVPAEEKLLTVAVPRLLVASDKVDESVIGEITRIIFENRQEVANAISLEHPEVKPLIASIESPSITGATGIPPIHRGALSFYERNKSSFAQENADFLALILTVALLMFSGVGRLKLWMESRKKNEADVFIESAIYLMKASPGQPENKQKELDDIFKKAADALVDERISQESFRTFNEAYKNTREAIERERQLAQQQIEQEQRKLSADHIDKVVKLLQYPKQSKDFLQQQLDKILQDVAADLIAKKISQASFRTFIEAYKTTRDVIERN